MIRILAVVGCLLWWGGVAQGGPITDMDLVDLKGLDRANLVAGGHGQQGRTIAASHHDATGSVQSGSFTTQLVALPSSAIQGATLESPTTVPKASGGDPPLAVPEPTSLLLLGSGLVYLSFSRFRKS